MYYGIDVLFAENETVLHAFFQSKRRLGKYSTSSGTKC